MSQVVKTLSTALVIHATLPSAGTVQRHDKADATPESHRLHATGDATTTPKDEFTTITALGDSLEDNTFSVHINTPAEWTKRTARRYMELVEKEAIGQLDAEEEAELEMLQRLKRREVNPPSAAEILHRYRQQKLDAGMLELVSRYVRFQIPESRKVTYST